MGGHNRNLNTAIVSLINFGRYVGHAVSFITVAHELGHNFGSSVSYTYLIKVQKCLSKNSYYVQTFGNVSIDSKVAMNWIV